MTGRASTHRSPTSLPSRISSPTDDRLHVIHYVILLDAERENVPWDEVAREALQIDPLTEPARARRAYETHLARAKWMANSGWRQMLRAGSFEGQV